mmetsp:Transcript_29826/g.60970  ORF Transcript_29826/g.60970 Transcript_29826/m.60970 type:complete len:204 (+) Transcript_29826:26-637(+)
MDGLNDDFFGNSSDEDSDALRVADTRANETRLNRIGFESALEEGKDRTLQEGFDRGFNKGIEEGYSQSISSRVVETLRRHPLYAAASDTELAGVASELIAKNSERCAGGLGGSSSNSLIGIGAASAAGDHNDLAPSATSGSKENATTETPTPTATACSGDAGCREVTCEASDKSGESLLIKYRGSFSSGSASCGAADGARAGK